MPASIAMASGVPSSRKSRDLCGTCARSDHGLNAFMGQRHLLNQKLVGSSVQVRPGNRGRPRVVNAEGRLYRTSLSGHRVRQHSDVHGTAEVRGLCLVTRPLHHNEELLDPVKVLRPPDNDTVDSTTGWKSAWPGSFCVVVLWSPSR